MKQPVPPLPSVEMEAVCGISAALASTSRGIQMPRRRCRDSVEVLMGMTEGFEPAQDVRHLRAHDDAFMGKKEVPGARLKYRLSKDIDLD